MQVVTLLFGLAICVQAILAASLPARVTKREPKSESEATSTKTVTQKTSATSSAARSRATEETDTDSKGKVNVTMASMQFDQDLCTNTTQVLSGSFLNVTWNSKGAYSNTVYVSTAADSFSAWTTGLPTQPGTAGIKLGNSKTEDQVATWQLSYQHQVFQYNKEVIFTVILRDEDKNVTVASWNTEPIGVVAFCKTRDSTDDDGDEADGSKDDSTGASASLSATAVDSDSSQPTGQSASTGTAVESRRWAFGLSLLSLLAAVYVSW